MRGEYGGRADRTPAPVAAGVFPLRPRALEARSRSRAYTGKYGWPSGADRRHARPTAVRRIEPVDDRGAGNVEPVADRPLGLALRRSLHTSSWPAVSSRSAISTSPGRSPFRCYSARPPRVVRSRSKTRDVREAVASSESEGGVPRSLSVQAVARHVGVSPTTVGEPRRVATSRATRLGSRGQFRISEEADHGMVPARAPRTPGRGVA